MELIIVPMFWSLERSFLLESITLQKECLCNFLRTDEASKIENE
jgi:hypothetical protein